MHQHLDTFSSLLVLFLFCGIAIAQQAAKGSVDAIIVGALIAITGYAGGRGAEFFLGVLAETAAKRRGHDDSS